MFFMSSEERMGNGLNRRFGCGSPGAFLIGSTPFLNNTLLFFDQRLESQHILHNSTYVNISIL